MTTLRLDPAFVLTEAVARAAGGVADNTLWRWCDRGLLPAPTRVGAGWRKGTFNRWPALAVERARWVRGLLNRGFTLDEIASLARGTASA